MFLLVGLFVSATPAFAAANPTTGAATGITSSDATLNATNGDTAADNESFWVSLTPGFDISNPLSIPPGVSSTPVIGGVGIGGSFSSPLSIVTTSGIPSNLPAITPSTTYYYVAWSSVGGVWSSGAITSVTTSPAPLLPQTITVGTPAPVSAIYGSTFPAPVAAISDSSLPVAITVTGGCSGSGSGSATITMTSGTVDCVVHYNQAGDGTYSSAPEVTENVTAQQVPITITAQTNTKVYDGTTSSATLSTLTSGTLVAGDVATLSETYDTKDVGTGKTLTPAVVIKDAGNVDVTSNYSITLATDITGVITQAPLTVTADNQSRFYGAANPVLTANYSGFVNGETSAVLTTPAVLNTAADGTTSVGGYPITVSGATSSDYNITFTTGTLTINAAPITVTADPQTKVYGDADPALTYKITSGALVNGDTFSGSLSRPVGNNVNTYAILQDTLSLSSNYALSYVGDNLTITAYALIVTAQTNTKVYNGTTSAASVPIVTGTLQYSDTANFIETYDTRNAGTGKTLTPSGVVNDGNSGNNYSYTFVNDTTGVISSNAIIVSALANTKVYDSTTSALTIPSFTGTLAAGDTAGFIENYGTKTVGAGKLIIPSGIVNDGNSGLNYSYTFVNSHNGVITQANLTISGLSAVDKTYDSTTNASVIGTISLVTPAGLDDVSTLGVPIGTFSDKHIGVGKSLAVSGLSLIGTDAANYTLTQPTLTATISPAPLTITAQTNTKIYDQTTSAVAVPIVAGLQGSDTVTGKAEVYSDKNVGTGKTLSVSTYTVNDGNGGNDYTVTPVTDVTGVITQKSLTVSSTGINKVYDSTTVATVTLSDNKIGGDIVSDNYTSASFSDKNVGNGKTVSVVGISITGADAGNYSLQNTTASTTANITARPITVTAGANTKVYDGTTSAATVPTITSGTLATGDTANFIEAYNNKNAGTGKALIPSGSVTDGNSGANYAVTFVNNVSGVITQKALTISATGVNKVYDATTAATVTLSDNKIAGDVVTDSYTSASFGDKNVGTAKAVSVTGISISGADAANYSFNTTASTSANITKAPLTITAITNSKIFDNSTSAAAVPTILGLQGTDTVTGLTETYDTSAVGAGKTLSVATYIVNDGNTGLNYSVLTPTDTTGVISAQSSGGGGGGGFIPSTPQVLGASTGPVPGCGDRTTGFSITTGQSCVGNTGNGQVLGASSFHFTLNLKMGSKGDEVMELQKFLNAAGYNCGTPDGKFGLKTKLALIKFQIANGLKGDGVTGPLTRAVLNK